MSYYRKGHFKKDGTWVGGHFVNRSRKKQSPQGCANVLIILITLSSVIIFILK